MADLPSEYSGLVHLFIELRGRGLSLSAQDVEVLRLWQQQELSVESVARVFLDIAAECREKQTIFPSTLAPIARRVKKISKQQAEF